MATDQDVEYVMSLNEKLADEISFLRDEIRFLREVVFKLQEKSLPSTRPVFNDNQEPIGGYVSARNRIADLERDSREKYNKDNSDASEE